MKHTDSRPNRGIRIAFSIAFLVLAGLRLYEFTRTGQAADALSGLGFLALAAGYAMTGTLVGSIAGSRAKSLPAAGRYLTIAGLVLIVSAIVMRLV